MLLSDGVWRCQFHRDPKIVGQVVELNKRPCTVVGVLPASFDFGAVFAPGMKFDVFVPAVTDEMRNWGNTLSMVGRLKPGVGVAQAQSEAETLFVQLQKEHRDWPMDYTPGWWGSSSMSAAACAARSWCCGLQ
jgi:MacB-like periplasmic core domain